MSPTEAAKVQSYLRDTFGNQNIRVKKLKNTDDSAELLLGEEFLGVIYRDDDEGEISFQLNVAILAEDL